MYKDCPNDIICNFCSEAGHKQKDCERCRASQVYGEYANDITEGRTADLDRSTGSVSHDEPQENIRRNLVSEMVHVVMIHENKMTTDNDVNSEATSDMTLIDNLTHENNTDEKNQNKTEKQNRIRQMMKFQIQKHQLKQLLSFCLNKGSS